MKKTLVAMTAIVLGLLAGSVQAAIVVDTGNITTGSLTGSGLIIDTPPDGTPSVPAESGWASTAVSGVSSGQNGWGPVGDNNNDPRWTGGTSGTTWTFDLADGVTINAVYAVWQAGGGSITGATYSYSEATSGNSGLISQTSSGSTGDLVYQGWNFQRVITGSITVAGGNGFTVTANGPVSFTSDAMIVDYTVPLDTPPVIFTLSPTNNATDVAIGTNLVATFNENIFTNTTGSIVITNTSDNVVFATIAIGDTNQVTVSDSALTIDPTNDLALDKSYAVLIDTNALKDAAGNFFTNSTTWAFTTVPPDTTAPVISTLSPTNNATDVAIGANLVATFNEDVFTNTTGSIVITNTSDNVVFATIAIGDTNQVTVSDTTLTIDPTNDLALGTSYAVLIDTNALTDATGNFFTNSTTWAFTTVLPDTTAPVIFTLSPTNNATDVAIGTNLVATFDEDVFTNTTGSIVITNTSDNEVFASIAIGDTNQVTISGTNLTIDPTNDLVRGTSYAVLIDTNSLMDAAGNLFAGITNATTWAFQTTSQATLTCIADTILLRNDTTTSAANLNFGGRGEMIIGGSGNVLLHRHGLFRFDVSSLATEINGGAEITSASLTLTERMARDASNASISQTFSAYGVVPNNAGWVEGTVNGVVESGSVSYMWRVNSSQKWDSGNTLFTFGTDAGSSLGSGTVNFATGSQQTLVITLNTNALKALLPQWLADGTSNAGLAIQSVGTSQLFFDSRETDDGVPHVPATLDITFIPDTTPPVVVTLSPTNNTTDVTIDANLVVTFSETIFTNTTGSIVITNTSDNVVFATIAIGDTNQVTISGNTLAIDPTADLINSKSYAVLIDTNALMDAATNYFAGMTSTTEWAFVTAPEDLVAPTLLTRTPTNDATDVHADVNLVATFNENIFTNTTGSIVITNLTDNVSTTIAVGDSSQISLSGTNLTINPTSDLEYDTQYAVLIDTNALTDLSGNFFAGITNATTWRFTVRSQPVGGVIIPANKIVSSTYGVIGSLVAIDVPYLGGAANILNASLPQGPDFPQDADYGCTFRDTGNNFLQYLSGTSAWEPDGTALADAKTYAIAETFQQISSPQVTWKFDFEDGVVINAIYASWTESGTGRQTVWGYTEGAITESYVQSGGATGDLVMQWTDAESGTHNGNFQRIFTNSVIVEGGDGFTLKATESNNVGPIDAIMIDATFVYEIEPTVFRFR